MYFSCVAQRAVNFVLWSFVVFVYIFELPHGNDFCCVCAQIIKFDPIIVYLMLLFHMFLYNSRPSYSKRTSESVQSNHISIFMYIYIYRRLLLKLSLTQVNNLSS